MGSFDPEILGEMLRACRSARGAYPKGKALEDFVEHVFTAIPSVELYARDVTDLDGTQEVDLVFSHLHSVSAIPIPDVTVIVECKNEVTKTSSEEITRFATKLRSRNARIGIFVTWAGLAGRKRPPSHAHAAIRDELGTGISIIVVTTAELAALADSTDLAQLLVGRLQELVTYRGYLSV
jgi:hypothetical protein